MPELKVRFTRGKDKKDVLSVTREDGSQSWQHQQPGIPVHDLTHFAVESALHLKNGFYGLLGQGWDITRLTAKDVRSTLPIEGLWAEFVVGLVQTERLSPSPLPADEFNALLDQEKEKLALKLERRITEEELFEIRRLFLELYSQWRRLQPGESLSLTFKTS
jgi:hypothetical protein